MGQSRHSLTSPCIYGPDTSSGPTGCTDHPCRPFHLLFRRARHLPPLGALADSLGGLTAARLLSLCFMLGTTALLYATTSRLFGRRAAACGAAIFAVLGPVQVLSAFATFDAMAIFFIALATWFAVRSQGNLSEVFLVATGLTLALADATKYASALWTPIVILIVALTAPQPGWRRPDSCAPFASLLTSLSRCVSLFGFGGSVYVQGIMFTTLARQANSTTHRLQRSSRSRSTGLGFCSFWPSRALSSVSAFPIEHDGFVLCSQSPSCSHPCIRHRFTRRQACTNTWSSVPGSERSWQGICLRKPRRFTRHGAGKWAQSRQGSLVHCYSAGNEHVRLRLAEHLSMNAEIGQDHSKVEVSMPARRTEPGSVLPCECCRRQDRRWALLLLVLESRHGQGATWAACLRAGDQRPLLFSG